MEMWTFGTFQTKTYHKMTLISHKFHGNIPFNFPPTSPTWTISPFRFVAAPTTLVQNCQSTLLQTHARFKISYKIQTCSSWCILSPWNFWLPSIFVVVLCKAPAKRKTEKPAFHFPFLWFLSSHGPIQLYILAKVQWLHQWGDSVELWPFQRLQELITRKVRLKDRYSHENSK